ncbi:envelope stress response protein PspG [Photobacterium sanguinicancri]|uniref:Envelope stress response protein PspG n=1 Tax=Photobacterium sanguinicancri TaxID=875932 RepID=A0AAW7YAU3_9GAMM|nr:envelope stress response protein PspG [Photobacterium sanguinicancri]KXI21611.1 phage shock protein G [Photobacterium sanguinicancri]MDO6500805.1 envelope stress response protein PspG [Photobacterium sanguinicancri]MDO6544619.1 envelope stress response protein PspG [Photobacterium sanguinicancri]OZS43746.1 envelope stress response protein PspG [Photobacterium sanguinicancri]
MVEILFLFTFAMVLIFTGISMLGMFLAVAAGFAVMAVIGMLGVMFKLLPWLIVIALGVWFYREHKADKLHRSRMNYRR